MPGIGWFVFYCWPLLLDLWIDWRNLDAGSIVLLIVFTLYAPSYWATSSPIRNTRSSRAISSSMAWLRASRTVSCWAATARLVENARRDNCVPTEDNIVMLVRAARLLGQCAVTAFELEIYTGSHFFFGANYCPPSPLIRDSIRSPCLVRCEVESAKKKQ